MPPCARLFADLDSRRAEMADFALAAYGLAGSQVGECLANIECRVSDIVVRHNIIVLKGLAAYVDKERKEQRTLHAVGDGTFIADGRKFDRKEKMRSKPYNGL